MERLDVCDTIGVSSCCCLEVLYALFALLWMHITDNLFYDASGSMEPAFQRGDILFLTNYDDPIRVGEIVVFKVKDRDIPIVHRVIKVHEKHDGKVSRYIQY